MLYTTQELADELGINPRLIRETHIRLGCPHQRNAQNHIMINGSTFRDWYLCTYAKTRLAEDEAFCMTCGRGVRLVSPTRKAFDGLVYITDVCPGCGRVLARILEMNRARS